MVANDAVADAQAKAGAFADVARREERIEDAATGSRGSMPWPVSLMKSSTAAGGLVEARPDVQALGGRPRIACSAFSSEVQQRLLELAAVGDDLRQPRLELGHELDAVQPEFVGAKRHHAAEQIGDVLRRARRRLPPREREQVADDLRGALRLLGDAPQVVREFGAPAATVALVLGSSSSSSSSCAYPMTLVSGLFSSCATPATSWPIAESFSAWSSCACVDFSRSSAAIDRAFASASSSLICCIRRALLDIFGDVLRHLHDRGAVAAAGDRERGHAEDLPVRTA